MKELKSLLSIDIPVPVIKCRVLEDNMLIIAVAKAPSMLLRAKHIGIKYHHFCSYVNNRSIEIKYFLTDKQLVDILTKPIPASQFQFLKKELLGW